jgi:7,8-dihydro-6-hydroxymethylpterin-pyrophosphokinase
MDDQWMVYRLGATQDAANENDKVQNIQVSLHLSYLYPTDASSFIKNQEFINLTIDTEQPQKPTEALNSLKLLQNN